MSAVNHWLAICLAAATASCSRDTAPPAAPAPSGCEDPAAASDVNSISLKAVGGASERDVIVRSSRAFPVRSALPVLYVGDTALRVSRTPDGDLHERVFRAAATDVLTPGAAVQLNYGARSSRPCWNFGAMPDAK